VGRILPPPLPIPGITEPAATMRKILIAACVLPFILGLGPDADSIGLGIFPNTSVLVGTSTIKVGSLTRVSSASCGGNVGVNVCHRKTPFLTRVAVVVKSLILAKNGSTTVDVTATNPGVVGIRGGFCADLTLGALVAGAGTKINTTGSEITHTGFFSRKWAFGLKAGTKTGLGELFVVGNCVNGNGRADGADEWGFHSSKLLATDSTPVRVYINANSVTSTGPGCDDGHGNQSVFGCPNPPTVGNANFRFEGYGLPPSSSFFFMLSVGGPTPKIDMTPLGAPGCFLRTSLQVEALGPTSGGDAVRGEGKVILPAPIPNNASLRGLVIYAQLGALDKKPKRTFPWIVTNGLKITIL
jgi:hypothetical protein